ncbi:P2Y purinoceptor 2-like [Neoarius graeffei]|uniref:P2Y purinoceptor 2-like n=1 Tax=Neoarius graeffei TaxID=443677 RepID=UPI00298C7555|nr:P2Y purinoceptor 2-like [Neoarius graeffei]
MNNTTETCSREESQHISLTVFLCLVYTIGLLLNVFSLWIFIFRMSKWNAGTVLQFNLAISDALAFPAIPLLAAYFVNGNNWEFGRFLCTLKIALLSAHFYGSILFLTLISIHRYVVVVHFKRSLRIKRKAFVKKLCFGVWCFLLIGAIIYGILLPVTSEDGHKQCLSIHQTRLASKYFIINFVLIGLGFLVPFTVAVVCYSCLARTVTQVNSKSLHSQSVKTKSLRTIGICLVIFGFCFFPLNVTRTVAVVLKKYFPGHCQLLIRVETAYYSSYVLAGVNCCLDPLIYFFGSHSFNKSFRGSVKIRSEKEKDNRTESDTISYSANRNAICTVSSGMM